MSMREGALDLITRPARRLLSRPRISSDLLAQAADPPPGPGVFATWTGVAGLRLEHVEQSNTTTVLLDPYVTRHSVPELALPLQSDLDTATRAFPKADAIFVGHSHHDHLFDAIPMAIRTGARLFGSASTAAVAKAGGVPEPKCVIVEDGQNVSVGPFDIEVVEHEHGRSLLGVPFPGDIAAPPPWPPFVWHLKAGPVLAYIIRVSGRTFYHQGSSGLTGHQLARINDLKPAAAFVCLALRQHTPHYEDLLFAALKPERVFAIHHDDFFGRPLTAEPRLMRGVDLPGFIASTRRLAGEDVFADLHPFERIRLR